MSSRVYVGIIGAGKGGTSIYKILRGIEHVEVIMVCDISDKAPGIMIASHDGIQTCSSIEVFCQQEMDVIIEATGVPEVQQRIEKLKSRHTSLMEAEGANLMMHIIKEKENLSEIKRLQVKLDTILSSAQEAIEVADIEELMPLDVLEKKMIRLALQRYGESVEGKKKAAQTLNISLATLYNKIKTF
ncbi:helix-turn-helix domain-containing protein [Desulfitobacterium sp.]|uniref:helix-turn-helix domain-containing protein n=1 Tax=Desulfitobacterium sp. TaxID=49981 RepID=UPI002C3F38E6|nr:helix-turn-helix domain-containing protein [Desulfitobacterium sp.]HVJ48714.1 helix-turn-helix domain-containing protein [Desulfitobacterium sp.]